MSKRELLAIMAAIVYSGADSVDGDSGYTPKNAVRVARAILMEVDKSFEEGA